MLAKRRGAMLDQRTVTDYYATHLVLGHGAVHDEREAQKHPRQVGCLEDQQAEEAEQRVWVLPTPDIYEGATEGGAEEGHGEHGGYAEKKGRSKGKQPREVGWRASGRLLEKARVALEEEDVVEQVEA